MPCFTAARVFLYTPVRGVQRATHADIRAADRVFVAFAHHRGLACTSWTWSRRSMGELLNLVGLSTGVVLYAMLLAMVVRASRTPGGPSRFDWLLLATSMLGLVWNLCALPAYELPKVGIQGPFPALVALGCSALGLLPAVVVHSVLRGERKAIQDTARRSVVAAAYAVSLLAGVLHAHAAL